MRNVNIHNYNTRVKGIIYTFRGKHEFVLKSVSLDTAVHIL